jgi:hypothetical protein
VNAFFRPVLAVGIVAVLLIASSAPAVPESTLVRVFSSIDRTCGAGTIDRLTRAYEAALDDSAASDFDDEVAQARAVVRISNDCFSMLPPNGSAAFWVELELLKGQQLIFQVARASDAYRDELDNALASLYTTTVDLCQSKHLLDAAFPYQGARHTLVGAIEDTFMGYRAQHIKVSTLPNSAIISECLSGVSNG